MSKMMFEHEERLPLSTSYTLIKHTHTFLKQIRYESLMVQIKGSN